jgi:hypothetical protein
VDGRRKKVLRERLRRRGLRGRALIQALAQWETEMMLEESAMDGRRVGREALARYIAGAGEWRLWITLTWPVCVGEDRRRWQAEHFLRKWLAGKWVAAWERHMDGRLHCHVLAEDSGGLRRLSMMDAWEVESGGYARVEEVRDVMAAALYIGKYMLKGGEQVELWGEV